MGKFTEIKGDLIKLTLAGNFDVIAQGINCFCTQKSGLAPQMVHNFATHHFPMEDLKYKGTINKLGTIDYRKYQIKDGSVYVSLHESKDNLVVVNCYTQYNYGTNHIDGTKKPLDYSALTLCMKKINHIFAGKTVGLPRIGAGLAGGEWDIIKKIIKNNLKDCDVVIVEYEK